MERTLKIKLIDLANQAPKFPETSLPPYKEGSASRIAGRVNAYDPDEASLEILNEPKFQIRMNYRKVVRIQIIFGSIKKFLIRMILHRLITSVDNWSLRCLQTMNIFSIKELALPWKYL